MDTASISGWAKRHIALYMSDDFSACFSTSSCDTAQKLICSPFGQLLSIECWDHKSSHKSK